jgi:hypothetical protein
MAARVAPRPEPIIPLEPVAPNACARSAAQKAEFRGTVAPYSWIYVLSDSRGVGT